MQINPILLHLLLAARRNPPETNKVILRATGQQQILAIDNEIQTSNPVFVASELVFALELPTQWISFTCGFYLFRPQGNSLVIATEGQQNLVALGQQLQSKAEAESVG